MTSLLRATRESPQLSRRFTVFPYYGAGASLEYYFTISGNSLYRIEADLSGSNQWIVARDMGKEVSITSIDPELIEFWENQNGWTNIQVVRNGRARKFQALAVPTGDRDASVTNNPAFNSGGYTDPESNMISPIYNSTYTGINDLLIMGNSDTTISNNYNQNLPFGTFYAVVDPVVIKYENGGTYTRAILNRVVPS